MMRSAAKNNCSASDPKDLFNTQDSEIQLKYRTDHIKAQQDICVAFRVDTEAVLKKWKKYPQVRLSSCLIEFLGHALIRDIEMNWNHDITLSLYLHGSRGLIHPTYQEFKRYWLGRPLYDFFIILSAPGKDVPIADAFGYYLDGEKIPVSETHEIAKLPVGSVPLYRMRKRQIAVYVQPFVVDPARGPQPCSLFLGFKHGWPDLTAYPMDPDPCLSQDLAAGIESVRPSISLLNFVEFGEIRGELKHSKIQDKKPADKPKKPTK